jgi:hypothetical protein
MRKSTQMSVSVITLVLFLSVGVSIGVAQGGVGSTRGLPETSGGNNMLEGRVRLPTGRAAGAGITPSLIKMGNFFSGLCPQVSTT